MNFNCSCSVDCLELFRLLEVRLLQKNGSAPYLQPETCLKSSSDVVELEGGGE